MRYRAIYTIMFLLLMFHASAQIAVEAEIDQNRLYLDEIAIFDLHITNYDEFSKVLNIYSADVRWNIELDPPTNNIGANESKRVKLHLLPSVFAHEGAQTVEVFVETPSTGDKISLKLPLYVKKFDIDNVEYSPSLQMDINFDEKLDPRKSFNVELYLRNRNALDIKNLDVTVESDLFSYYNTVALGPLSEHKETFTFEVADTLPPGEHDIEVRISIQNKTINNERSKFSIIRYASFNTRPEISEDLFKTTAQYTILNEGNVNKVEPFRIPTNFFQHLFTSTEPKPSLRSLKGDGYYEWQVNLDPKQTTTIKIVVNYRPIIYVLLIAVVLYLVYFLYRSPILIKKESFVIGSSQQGITDMKVLLHIRNRTQELMEHVTITDMIPSIADLVKQDKLGTMAPSKIIRHQKKGTIIKWEIEALEPFEERIISYKIMSNIAIVGGFTLPPAKAAFAVGRGKERVVRSDKSSVSIGL